MNEQNRKDISVLVIEKNLYPEGEPAHCIFDIVQFLAEQGFNVDLVQGISNWRFNDFEETKREIEERRKDKYSHIEDEELRESLEKTLHNYPYEFLRKTPIKSIDDLASYRFIIAHPWIEDARLITKEFMKKYPNIPIICPDNAASIGLPDYRKRDFPIHSVHKDKDGEFYVVNSCNMIGDTIILIEYLLEQQEKQEAVEKR